MEGNFSMNSSGLLCMRLFLVGFLLVKHRAAASCGGYISCSASNSKDCNALYGCEWDRNIDTSCDPVFGCFTSTWWSCDRRTGAACADLSTQSACEDRNGCAWQEVIEDDDEVEDETGISEEEEEEEKEDQEEKEEEEEEEQEEDKGLNNLVAFAFGGNDSEPEGLSAGAIVGIVLGLVVLHGVSIALIWNHRKKHAGNRPEKSPVPDETMGIKGAFVGFVNKHHSIFLWAVFGLSIVCWTFTVATTGSCQFLTVDGVGFGFFNYEDGDGCKRIDDEADELLDSGLKAGRTFAVFACLLMSAALVLVVLVQLVLRKGRDILWLSFRILLYCSAWCTMLMFMASGTKYCDDPNVECKVGPVGILNIFNLLLLTGLNAILFFIEAAEEPVLKILGALSRTASQKATVESPSKDKQQSDETHTDTTNNAQVVVEHFTPDEENNFGNETASFEENPQYIPLQTPQWDEQDGHRHFVLSTMNHNDSLNKNNIAPPGEENPTSPSFDDPEPVLKVSDSTSCPDKTVPVMQHGEEENAIIEQIPTIVQNDEEEIAVDPSD